MADEEPQVGDWVHVHGHGVGVVQSKEKHVWDASPHTIDFNPSGGGTETLILRYVNRVRCVHVHVGCVFNAGGACDVYLLCVLSVCTSCVYIILVV